ncbi:MAG: hypothetical protein HYV28_15720, partial [Ignavibacteriales bacterium]|nr:hypothetical protein [Ignavibacteriales bacterium]
ITIKFGGKYQYDKWRDGAGLGAMFDSYRVPLNERSVTTVNFKANHMLANNLYYDINLSYYGDFFATMDPEIKHDILGYGDSLTNDKYGYLLAGDGRDVQAYALYNQTFNKPGNQLSGYAKTKNKNYTVKVDVFWQLNKQNEVKTGFEYTYHTIRRYSFASAFDLRTFVTNNPDAPVAQWYERVDNYGYDIYGNLTDESGIYAPKHPQFFGAYIQDKLEFSDLVINAGLRLDGIVTDSKEFNDPSRVQYDANGLIDESSMKGFGK